MHLVIEQAFCILNDQAIASNYLINNGLSKKVLILDLDVHQGNGTAEIFKNNKQVFTVSFHGKNNYPFRKEVVILIMDSKIKLMIKNI